LDDLRPLVLIIALTLASAGCGRFLAAIPRHKEIERPVTALEVVGRWTLTTNSLRSVMVDGFAPRKGEEVMITVRSNASYSCHMIFAGWDGKSRVVGRADAAGQWSLDYSSTSHFKNALVLRSDDAVSSLYIALDSRRMILWSSWGDPDDGIDLVFEKVREK